MSQKIILDAHIHYGQKCLMAKVYEGETLVWAQADEAAKLREIIARDFPEAEVIEPTNQAEVDAEYELYYA